MATVYSKSHLIQIEFSPAAYGATNLTWNHQHKATVNTADLLAALDAVPREDFDKAVALSEQRQTKLEEAVAAIDLVKARVGYLRRIDPLNSHYPFALGVADGLAHDLTPPKRFELPTEAGARFEARFNDGDPEEFTAWTDGTEVLYKGYAGWNDAGRFANGGWHDFRLLDGDAA